MCYDSAAEAEEIWIGNHHMDPSNLFNLTQLPSLLQLPHRMAFVHAALQHGQKSGSQRRLTPLLFTSGKAGWIQPYGRRKSRIYI